MTKTISQINNVLNELQKTCYKIRNAFLSSRKFSCLGIRENPKLMYDAEILSEMCKNDMRYCDYYKLFDKLKPSDNTFIYKKYDNLTDIEDLFKAGKKDVFCPYFYNINKTKDYANITFMSYHYVLNPFVRNKLNIIEENAIIILDEAHNICNVFQGLFSKKMEKDHFYKVEESLILLLDKINEEDKGKIYYDKNEINPLLIIRDEINKEINKIKSFIQKIEKIDKMKTDSNNKINKEDIYICTIEEFKDLFFKNFQTNIYERILNSINSVISKIEKQNNILDDMKEISSEVQPYLTIKKDIKKMYNFLRELESLNDQNKNSYRLELHYDKNRNVCFGIYCIDASYGMKNFMKVKPYSVILTSGTLSINILENLLQIKFYKTLNNKHIINKIKVNS